MRRGFGGKRTLAPTIVAELGSHRAYWEPFCGSMAVLLAKGPAQQETVCDLHRDLINLARVLADPSRVVELYDRLQRTLFSEDLFEQARARLKLELPAELPAAGDVDRAFAYFVFSWMGRNGLAGTNRAPSTAIALRFTPGGGSPAVRFRGSIESIPSWHDRLRNVVILQRDSLEVLAKVADEPGVAIYADPPYLFETRSENASHEQGAQYCHDFKAHGGALFGAGDDHARLADILGRFRRARVVISYYGHPRLGELYPGWTCRPLEANKNIANQNKRGGGGSAADEVILINGPSLAPAAEVA